jgi:hypothetical protein
MLGIMGATGSMDLPAGLETLENPWVIAAAGAMYVVEFFADKIPGVDSAWDTIHSFIRVPAGAVLAATVFADASTAEMLAAGAGGSALTAATHTIKAGSRLLINTSPEPFSNWTASVSEDVAVFGGLWLALAHPAVFIGVLVVFILLAIWLLPKLWRAIRMLFFEDRPTLRQGDRDSPARRRAGNARPEINRQLATTRPGAITVSRRSGPVVVGVIN